MKRGWIIIQVQIEITIQNNAVMQFNWIIHYAGCLTKAQDSAPHWFYCHHVFLVTVVPISEKCYLLMYFSWQPFKDWSSVSMCSEKCNVWRNGQRQTIKHLAKFKSQYVGQKRHASRCESWPLKSMRVIAPEKPQCPRGDRPHSSAGDTPWDSSPLALGHCPGQFTHNTSGWQEVRW